MNFSINYVSKREMKLFLEAENLCNTLCEIDNQLRAIQKHSKEPLSDKLDEKISIIRSLIGEHYDTLYYPEVNWDDVYNKGSC